MLHLHVAKSCPVALIAIMLSAGIQHAVAQDRSSRAESGTVEIYQKQRNELVETAMGEYRKLLVFCVTNDLREGADVLRKAIADTDTTPELPSKLQASISLDLPAGERQWRTKRKSIDDKLASELNLLARRAIKAGFASFAYDLMLEAGKYDPDNRALRRLLGFVQVDQEWLTPFQANQKRLRKVWHRRYGWINEDHIARYDEGMRQYKGRWMTAEKEAAIRSDPRNKFRNGWHIRTEHFLVKTDHSLERGVEIATALEEFHEYFFRAFAAFFNSPDQMQRLFAGQSSTSRRIAKQPYEVHYFRKRDDYNQELVVKIPQIALTNGLYYMGTRTSYFFDNPGKNDLGTMFHEATHQFLYESFTKHRNIAERSDFWIIEGIACYMESFKKVGDKYTIGDIRHPRIQAAYDALMRDRFFIPFSEFASMGRKEFQTQGDLVHVYSQVGGLTHFFMHHENGRDRDALIAYLTALYNPDSFPKTPSLADLTKSSFAEIDKAYNAYIGQIYQGRR
ncbi:MAG: DUF1570 domain-containing protein [Planctomycetota bacterium]|nr:DUF1570 domain-containing protein [Planctomycetota bacterium]